MPQDHASWDRKELLRQRKHDRPEQSFESPPFRWRDSPSSHHVPREFSSRLGSGDFRRPSCKTSFSLSNLGL
jgi:nuclear receptor co-repressor 1